MKQCTKLKRLSATAATLSALLLVMPAQAQEEPQPNANTTDGSPEAGATAEESGAAAQGEQDQAAQGDTPEAPAESSEGEGEDAQAGDNGDAETQSADDQDQAQGSEGQNYEEALRGLTWEQRFEKVDANDNSVAEWDELEQTYTDELAQAEWDQENAIEPFDRDQDRSLDQAEYLFFLSGLQQELTERPPEQELSEGGSEQEEQSGPEQEEQS